MNDEPRPRRVARPIPKPPDELTLTAIAAETMRARALFPDNRHLLAALLEECGEVARALLEHKPKDELERECIQVAAMAVRLLEEGDSAFAQVEPVALRVKPCKECGERSGDILQHREGCTLARSGDTLLTIGLRGEIESSRLKP